MRRNIHVEVMRNGLTSIRCYASGLTGCFDTKTGAYRHGDLRLAPHVVLAAINHPHTIRS